MGQPYIGEIRMFAGNFPPNGWMTCDGQLLPIAGNDTLYNLIGTTYGGDGQNTFGLPNLSGRVPVHMGTGASGSTYTMGEMGGASSVTLTTNQIPNHTHPIVADDKAGTQTQPGNDYYANVAPAQIYSTHTGTLHPMMNVQNAGGSQPHDNNQPSLAVTFIISLFGVYPSPT